MPLFELETIRIVVVEPAGPRNVGSIARVMKNMGLTQLVLVNPQCDPLDEEARHMAVHAVDILESAAIVPSLPAALQGCQRAIATTARVRALNLTPELPRVALPWLIGTPSALIFGREDNGLTNLELNYAQRYVSIPASADYATLNLAQAVAICCYELSQHTQADQTPASWAEFKGSSATINADLLSTANQVADLDELEGYFQHLELVLLKIGYLFPHTAASRMAKLRQIYKRAYPSQPEIGLLRGILRQTEWAVQHPEQVNLEP
jgi:tRNA/rRNA methyltransferase